MAFSLDFGKWVADWFSLSGNLPAPPATIYLALNTGDPLADNSGANEVVGSGYTRMAITFTSVQNGLDTYQITNIQPVVFPVATATDPLAVTHWSLFDADTGGTMLLHGRWDQPKQWLLGTSFTIAINAFLADVYTKDVTIT